MGSVNGNGRRRHDRRGRLLDSIVQLWHIARIVVWLTSWLLERSE